jgi:ATP-dependent helicase/nuclease subunit A
MVVQVKNIKQILDSNYWVSASAGTGKTRSLIDRLLYLLLSGVKPETILCITFTKNAALEMSIRLNQELSKYALATDAELKRELAKIGIDTPNGKQKSLARGLFLGAVDGGSNVKIQTIHAFCQRVLQQFPIEAGVNSNFEIIEGNSLVELIKEIKLSFFYDMGNDKRLAGAFEDLSSQLSERELMQIFGLIVAERGKIQSCLGGSLEGFIDRVCKKLNIDTNVTFENCTMKFLHEFKMNLELLNSLQFGSKVDKSKFEKLRLWYYLDIKAKQEHIEGLINCFLTKKKEVLKRVVSKKLADDHPLLFDYLIDLQNQVLEFIESSSLYKLKAKTESLAHICTYVLERYMAIKQKKGCLDYLDFIEKCYELLSSKDETDWVLYKLDNKIDHILIDEAQDTNILQWKLIERLTEEYFSGKSYRGESKSLFVVGDQKQSIYSFQGAQSELFMLMNHFFDSKSKASENRFHNISLSKSYRSSSSVLKLVDQVFKDDNLKSLITSEHAVEHVVTKDVIGKCSLWPITYSQKDKEDEKSWETIGVVKDEESASKKLANQIAEQIKFWLDNGKLIESKNRQVKLSDILILIRTRNKFTDHLINSLTSHGIPNSGLDRVYITEHIVSRDIIALCSFLVNGNDDYSLASVLKSSMYDLDDDDLFELCYQREESSVWERLVIKSKTKKKYLNAVNDILKYKKLTRTLTPYELIFEIIISYRSSFVFRYGESINALLNELIELAVAYEKAHVASLQGFINWIKDGNAEVKQDYENNLNVVNIMTVHGAKGLQAPIVLLPDTTTMPIAKNKIVYHDDLFFWIDGGNGNKTINSLLRQKKDAEYAEYVRLLYVALTRAEDELLICGYSIHQNINESCWFALVERAFEEIGEKDEQQGSLIGKDDKYRKAEFAGVIVDIH